MNSPFVLDTKTIQYIIGEGALKFTGKLFKAYSSAYILMDENVEKYCLSVLLQSMPDIKIRGYIKIPAGESSKSIEHAVHIWEKLTDMGAGRDSLLINLGGGVVSDIGGFCAATYKRGMPYINIPTTLLAQIDAAIGGKTGIDFKSFKNQVGLFTDAKAVIVDPVFLKTLKHEYWQSGFAEVTKYALIMDRELWKMLGHRKFNEIDDWNKIIIRSAKDKIDIVRYDNSEKGIRKILNFGHTVGHAIESFYLKSGRPITHGQAIAAGMICEAWISAHMEQLECENVEEIIKRIDYNFDRLSISEDNIPELTELMRQDKKIRGGEFMFSLLRRLGKAVHDVAVDVELIRNSLLFYINKKKCN
jgi:3-dehydroquinate synthase